MFEIIIKGKENVERYLDFEKEIPFEYSYGYYGCSYDMTYSKISVMINSKRRINLYWIIINWLKKEKIKFEEKIIK